MSPYRVLVQDKYNVVGILASMLSTDKLTGKRRIFIVEKTGLDAKEFNVRALAHTMTRRSNSTILGQYEAYKDEDCRSYNIDCIRFASKPGDIYRENVANHEYTLQDCLLASLSHFCNENGLKIVRSL